MRIGMLAVVVLAGLALPATALGHAERYAYFPDYTLGEVPEYRTSGPSLVVCKEDSAQLIDAMGDDSPEAKKARKYNRQLLEDCEYSDIQAAVNAAGNGYRILVLPGVYEEEPSRAVPTEDPDCQGDEYEAESPGTKTYKYQRDCPNAHNLIAITGDDDDEDRICDDKCDLQLEGTGLLPEDVVIRGAGFGETPGAKLNLIRADRADGVVIANFLLEYSDFNNIYVLETNGFRIQNIVTRWSREYGVLSFTSDNGLYDHVEAYGSGDSGIYPGSGPEGHCERYGIEIRHVDSYGNAIGWSGTAGNGVYTHHSKFHDNAAGITMDSINPGHPGMPQDCSKFEKNEIYSNNAPLFETDRDEYCAETPVEERDPTLVCPTFPIPVGTGVIIAGGNANIIRDNKIWDNWRYGTMQLWIPSFFRGEDPTGQSDPIDPENPYDTSFDNKYIDNRMGVAGGQQADPNGTDFWWDEEGAGNYWTGNSGPFGATPTSDPSPLPGPPGNEFSTGNEAKQLQLLLCGTWHPVDNPDPPGCDWFYLPPEPE